MPLPGIKPENTTSSSFVLNPVCLSGQRGTMFRIAQMGISKILSFLWQLPIARVLEPVSQCLCHTWKCEILVGAGG